MADARNRANVLVGAPDVNASGGALIGEVATDSAAYPVDASTELSVDLGMEPAGFIGEDGVTKNVNRTTEKIRDWNRDTVIVVETEHDVTLSLTFLESANATVLKAIYGEENVFIEGNKIQVMDAAGELPHKSLAFEMKGGADKKARLFAADAQVTNVGDITFTKAGLIQYQVDFECFGDAEGKKLRAFFEIDAEAESPSEDPEDA